MKLTDKERAAVAAANAIDKRVEIIVKAGDQPFSTDEAEKVLVANAIDLRVFQRGGDLVRMITLAPDIDSGGLASAETMQLQAMTQQHLQDVFERLIAFRKFFGKGKRAIDCPSGIALKYLSRVGNWKLPKLTGFIEAPIIRNDGTVLDKPGYDPITGLYLIGAAWPKIPAAPTKAVAKNALDELLAPFDEFPFVSGASKSVFAGYILTLIQRRLLKNAPLFSFNAPEVGTGKGKLVKAGALIALGRDPGAQPISSDRDEFHKALTTVLREGRPLNCWDNFVEPFDSAAFASCLTTDPYQARLLGENRQLSLRTNCTHTATGNNIVFKGEMPRRVVQCSIDANMEKPYTREFKISDLDNYLLENRGRLVAAALTVLKGYAVAGRPRQEVKPFGSFDDWSAKIREPLVWLGMNDPCLTTGALIDEDPQRESRAEIIAAWYNALGEATLRIGEIVLQVNTYLGAGDGLKALRQKLLGVAAEYGDRNSLDPDRLGKFCRTIQDRVFNGLVLRKEGSETNAKRWRVERTRTLVATESIAAALRSLLPTTRAPLRVVAGRQSQIPRKKKFGKGMK